jgi:hypothetical protein
MRPHLLALVALACAVTGGAPASAGSLENLERERAVLLAGMRDAALAPDERQIRIEAMARRLRDLEQMAMRDDALIGRNTATVRQAFAQYELTFLVHAAAEDGVILAEQWLSAVGLDTERLLEARVGRRVRLAAMKAAVADHAQAVVQASGGCSCLRSWFWPAWPPSSPIATPDHPGRLPPALGARRRWGRVSRRGHAPRPDHPRGAGPDRGEALDPADLVFWRDVGFYAAGGIATAIRSPGRSSASPSGSAAWPRPSSCPRPIQAVIRDLTRYFGMASSPAVVGLPLATLLRAVVGAPGRPCGGRRFSPPDAPLASGASRGPRSCPLCKMVSCRTTTPISAAGAPEVLALRRPGPSTTGWAAGSHTVARHGRGREHHRRPR